MAKFFLTRKAVEDLSEIWSYTFENWSETQADKYYDLLISACSELAERPMLGKNYDIVSVGLLGYKSGEHIIFYKMISDTEIEVIRILHGMMDLKSHL